MKQYILLVSLFSLVLARNIVNKVGRAGYTAAVVEFSPTTWTAALPQVLVRTNLERYEAFIQQAADQNADIVVFPEYGLTTLTPAVIRDISINVGQEVNDPSVSIYIPCNLNTTDFHQEVLQRLSCAARDNNIYLVANMIEREPCQVSDKCKDGFLIFNTNVAFDRQGSVVARYRKFNLFSEKALNVTSNAELSTFTTDFGAKFGLFTCMDLLFYYPSIQLVLESEITDVAFPTAWFSELPFLTAVQAQSEFSYGFDVTLLAAGYNDPEAGNTGSGVFAGLSGGSLVHLMAQVQGSTLLVARVPEMLPRQPRQVNKNLKKVENTEYLGTEMSRDLFLKGDYLVNFSSIAIPSNIEGVSNVSVCQANLCCHLQYEIAGLPEEQFNYRLLVLDGIMSHDGGFYQSRTQVCGFVACSGFDTQSCSDNFTSTAYAETTTFKSALLSGIFETKFVQPNTLLAPSLSPLQPYTDFTFDKSDEEIGVAVKLQLERPITAIHSFAIFAHDYLS